MVKLLNHGFPLNAALSVASQQSFVGGQYSVVGDGEVDIVQGNGLGVSITRVSESSGGFDVSLRVYPTTDVSVGSTSRMAFGADSQYHLTPGTLPTVHYSNSGLLTEELLDGGGLVKYGGEILWPEELDL
jgi:hypothetical protein